MSRPDRPAFGRRRRSSALVGVVSVPAPKVRRHPMWVPLVLAPLVLAGCTVGGGSDAPGTTVASATPTTGADDAALAEFYGQALEWESCVGYESSPDWAEDFENPNIVCAMLEVPVDYANPEGERAQIAVRRKPAQGERVGSLMYNPGGPGVEAISWIETLAARLGGLDSLSSYDLVAFDPRGIGSSVPQVQCLSAQERDAERAKPDLEYTDEGIATIEADSKEYVESCVANTGEELLANVGTRDVARDMDILRAALGDEKVNYLGLSYGTYIGAIYAEAFPNRVRAMVLDGAVDPNEDPTMIASLQYAGFQGSFDAFAEDCASSADCPLGDSPELAVKMYRSLVDPLLDAPAPTESGRELSYSDAVTGTIAALYGPEGWSLLRDGLAELSDGRGDTLLGLADSYLERRDDGSYSNVSDVFTAVLCVDSPAVTDRATAAEMDAAIRAAAPVFDDGRATGQAPLDVCAFWPVPNTLEPHTISAPGLPTLLVISTTGDPATPYEAGVLLADQLGARLLTVEGEGHTATFNGDDCVLEALDRYLGELAVPEEGARC